MGNRCLVPELKPGDVVIWDNLSVHGDQRLRMAIERCGAVLAFLAAYSPDLNPIEQVRSKIKTIVRKLMQRWWKKAGFPLSKVLQAVTASDAIGWFKHAGRTIPDLFL